MLGESKVNVQSLMKATSNSTNVCCNLSVFDRERERAREWAREVEGEV